MTHCMRDGGLGWWSQSREGMSDEVGSTCLGWDEDLCSLEGVLRALRLRCSGEKWRLGVWNL